MTQDTSTYYVWIGGSCDYGHKERAGGAAVVIEHNGNIISRDVISDLHTTEFRMMLTLMVKVMQEIPEGSDILFLTNAAYIQNFDKTPTAKSANPDLIIQCFLRRPCSTPHRQSEIEGNPYRARWQIRLLLQRWRHRFRMVTRQQMAPFNLYRQRRLEQPGYCTGKG